MSRCAVVTFADAFALQQGLAAAWSQPAIPVSERMEATLEWRAVHTYVSMSLASLLPDDPRDCSVETGWP